MERLKLATTWLGGCSGCHMSFLDLDEFLIDLAEKADIVYTPIADIKEYPDGVDVVLIEGAVATEDHVEHVRTIRARTKLVISFGDCAVTGNVTSLRNPLGGADVVLKRSYLELATINPQIPSEKGIVPKLLDRVVPVHNIVPVDFYMPGCPPPAERIRAALVDILDGRMPHLDAEQRRFG
jgi:NAD-reducing hydrogenase small subunit